MLLVSLPSTTYSQNSTSCDDRVASAKSIAQQAIDKAAKAEAREKKATEQRDAEIALHVKTKEDRDKLNGQLVEVRTNNLELNAKVAPLMVQVTMLEAANKKLKTQRWLTFGAGLVLGVVGGVGAVLWVSK